MHGIIPLKGRTVEVLSREEIVQVHRAVLDILNDPGINIEHEEALDIFRRAGAEIDHKQIVHIPSFLVERALAQAPRFVTVCGRDPKYDVTCGTGEVYFNSGHGAPFVIDFDTGERRPATKKDLENLIRIQDALENTHKVSLEVIPQDVPQQALVQHTVQAVLSNTEKPCSLPTNDGKGARDAIRMCVAIAGSEEALRRRPILMTSFPVVSPLTFDPDKVDVLLEFCRFGLPVQTYSIPAAGGTSPVTLAGSLAQQMAEVLAGVILGQLIRPGAPIRVAGNGAIIDQKYGSFVLGCPEAALIIAASAQMFRYYGLPYALLGGESQARTLDMQAGYEKGIITLLSALSGAGDILPGVASTVGGAEFSIYEQAVIANDICGMIYRILQGIEVNPDTLAVSVIREVGPGGHFLKQRHTREHYKLENWEPKVSNRIMSREEYEESGARDVRVRAREEVKRILATHHPKPLSEAAQRKLEQIVKEAEG